MQITQRHLTTKLDQDKNMLNMCYKFRGIRTDCKAYEEVDLSRIEDILNGYLYCSDWRELNDVLEGKYYYIEPNGRDSNNSQRKLIFGERLQKQKEAYKVCSLTTALTNPLMWAFYASDNAGVAIEIKLPYPREYIVPVTYSETIPVLDLTLLENMDKSDVDGSWTKAIARHILTHKTIAWEHEQEVRILIEGSKLRGHKYEIQKPTQLYYGPRMVESVYCRLQEICTLHNVKMTSIATVDEEQFGKYFDFQENKFVDS